MPKLMPAKTKYRKQHKGRNRGIAKGGNYIAYGEVGLYAKTNGLITSNQIESARVTITRKIKKGGKLWIRVFPDKPLTKKPPETRQGKGKGNVELWVAPVKRGRVLFELGGCEQKLAEEALQLASYKLPIITGVKVR